MDQQSVDLAGIKLASRTCQWIRKKTVTEGNMRIANKEVPRQLKHGISR